MRACPRRPGRAGPRLQHSVTGGRPVSCGHRVLLATDDPAGAVMSTFAEVLAWIFIGCASLPLILTLITLAINTEAQARGLCARARGWLGYQLGIRTDCVYSKARIQAIDGSLLKGDLERGIIPVIAGFQGVDPENNITTLGRGGGPLRLRSRTRPGHRLRGQPAFLVVHPRGTERGDFGRNRVCTCCLTSRISPILPSTKTTTQGFVYPFPVH